MKKPFILSLMLVALVSGMILAQNNQPYLGQDPPGMTTQRFPPDSLLGNSNWWWHGSPVFSPDGLEMFWTEYVRYSLSIEKPVLFTMKVTGNNWGPIQSPFFGDTTYMENSPVFSVGGDSLFFLSTRPGGPYFMTTRIPGGWSPPVAVQIPRPSGSSPGWQFAVNRNGDFYIELSLPPAAEPDIYVSRYVNGNYQMAQKLGNQINSPYLDGFPYIEPYEEYLIFASNRPGGFGGQFDNYICFKNLDGSWSDAINMGFEINETGAWFATVTIDKQYLFFNSLRPGDAGYNPYWISASVIDSLRTLVGISDPERPSTMIMLYQNEPNPFKEKTQMSFELEEPALISAEVTDRMGREVMCLFRDQFFQHGKHTVLIDATGLQNGLYIFVLKVNNERSLFRKMIITR